MSRRRTPRRRRGQPGIALLMVITAITILSLVVMEFSNSARTHMDQGINLRDEARATALADTALIMTRACLDPATWGIAGAMMGSQDMERVCNLVLGIFTRGRVDVPGVGLSMELGGIQGIGISKGEIEEIKLTSEGSFLGLAGLRCPGGAAAPMTCGSRKLTANQLRSALCDPSIADVFEDEQEDGKKYTREEVVANLVDWIDPDDNKIAVTNTWDFEAGVGENEDSYWKSHGADYKVKDAIFDSIEELRLIPGVNDKLYDFLSRRVSVFGSGASGKVDVNQVSAPVLSDLLWAAAPAGAVVEGATCGQQEVAGLKTALKQVVSNYARMITDAREILRNPILNPQRLLAKAFKNAQAFMAVAKDPLKQIAILDALGGQGSTDEIMLARYGMTVPIYTMMKEQLIDWSLVQQMVDTKTQLYRLRAQATVGNISRRIMAVLKRDGAKVHTLYYREE